MDSSDNHRDDAFDIPETPSGGMLAIVLLVVAILMLVFLFRHELGIGTPTMEVAIPERIVDAPDSEDETPPVDALDPAD